MLDDLLKSGGMGDHQVSAALNGSRLGCMMSDEASEMVQARFALTADRARHLRELAEVQRISEDEVIARALDLFFRLTDSPGEEGERGEWASLSEESLSRVWDNAEDAAYDNWREMHGVAAR